MPIDIVLPRLNSYDESLVLCSLVDAGLSDYAVICQILATFGIVARIIENTEAVEVAEMPDEALNECDTA